MRDLLKKVLSFSAIVSTPLLTPVLAEEILIADSSMSQSQILKRLNALEAEVKSLRRQLKSTNQFPLAKTNSEKENNLYLTSALGKISVDDVTCSDCEGDTSDSGNFAPTSINGDWSGEFGMGYRFSDNFRGEITYSVISAKNEDNTTTTRWEVGEFDTHSLFASGYYDFLSESKFSPYIGLGLGPTFIDTDQVNSGYYASDTSEVTFGYQAKVGMSYKAFESADLFIEGVHKGTKAFRLGATGDDTEQVNPLKTFSAQLGVRYKF